jgi:pyruvyl transferase EpsO
MTPTSETIATAGAATLAQVLGGYTECALLDYPDYANVGDSAIWLGQVAALKQLGLKIRYVAQRNSISVPVLRQRMKRGVVLINGGGNFGTIWPELQEHREYVLAELRDYPIVQMPQSIHYDNAAAIARTRALIEAHPDFTLLVRDEPSRRMASDQLAAKTVVCTDCALFLRNELRRNAPCVDLYVLARTDKERVAEGLAELLAGSGVGHEMGDWVEEPMTAPRWLADKLWPRAFGRLTQLPGFFPLLTLLWNASARERLHRGTRLLSRGRVVVTDRLHGHILCLMLDIPHVVLDNSYGKVQSFIAAWSEGNPLVHRASTPSEAVAKALALLPTKTRGGGLAAKPVLSNW